jgi:hypothetical protein
MPGMTAAQVKTKTPQKMAAVLGFWIRKRAPCQTSYCKSGVKSLE